MFKMFNQMFKMFRMFTIKCSINVQNVRVLDLFGDHMVGMLAS